MLSTIPRLRAVYVPTNACACREVAQGGKLLQESGTLSAWCVCCRASQWASHFEITDINKNLKDGEAYTYDLEWSPDSVKPPIKQNVRGVPPAYIE